MYKLLVNAPTGAQEIVTVGEGGGYFDTSRVLWDERADGPLPDITLGGMVRNGQALEFDQSRMDSHTAAIEPHVQEVSNAQAREALIRSGISISSVDAALAAITDPVEREVAVTQWEYRSMIRRDAELVVSMAGAMNLTPAQVDDLFRLAATL
jgi:hypothetical protein